MFSNELELLEKECSLETFFSSNYFIDKNTTIQVCNLIDGTKPPPFKYIYENKLSKQLNYKLLNDIKGCEKSCKEHCENGIEFYNSNGLLNFIILSDFPTGGDTIIECNKKCKCKNCKNRVVQNGLQIKLELFKTREKGWGVRTLTDIVRGSFVVEYIGEMCSNLVGHEKSDYLFHLIYDENCIENNLFIDSEKMGNIARFLNHSCDPNLIAYFVIVDDFTRVAFFAERNIRKYEELTFDYGSEYTSGISCKCNSKYCRGIVGEF